MTPEHSNRRKEHAHEYEEVLRSFRESFQPRDAAEDALVLRLAQAHCRSLRSRRIETGIRNLTVASQKARARKLVDTCPEHLNPHNAIAVGFMTDQPNDGECFFVTTRWSRASSSARSTLDAPPKYPPAQRAIAEDAHDSGRPINRATWRSTVRFWDSVRFANGH